MKVRQMLATTVPAAKAKLYSIGMATLFFWEIGPLVSGLLLSGRIGGSYAGYVANLQVTHQNHLLQTLGMSEFMWSLFPSLFAAFIAGPILTLVGTYLAIYLGGLIGVHYGILESTAAYWESVKNTVFSGLQQDHFTSPYDTLLEVATYPPCYHVLKSFTFMLINMGVAELFARRATEVKAAITRAVVCASILIIVADWGFSQLWTLRK